jgi:hypothetical protein
VEKWKGGGRPRERVISQRTIQRKRENIRDIVGERTDSRKR